MAFTAAARVQNIAREYCSLLPSSSTFFLVLDINQLAGAEHFLREVTGLAGNVKNCPKAEGVQEIMVPGEPERRTCAARRQSGITLDDGTWKQLTDLAARLNATPPVPV